MNDFATGDVSFTGSTAGGTLVGTVTQTGPMDGTTYNVAVGGMTSSGTVVASIAAGIAHDAETTANDASTSADNTVTFNEPAPVLGATAQIAVQQLDSTHFRYTLTLDNTGTTTVGTFWYGWIPGEDFMPVRPTNILSPTGWTAQVTNDGAGDGFAIQWKAISGGSDLAAGGTLTTFQFDSTATPAQIAGNSQFFPGTPVSTSFVYIGQPLLDPGFQLVTSNQFDLTPPSVTINQASGQTDPTTTSPINFTVVFSEAVTDFATGDVSFTGSTAAGTLVGTVTQTGAMDGTTYNVAVSGMTGSGTVVATIAAGVAHDEADNANTASTSSDDTVTFNVQQPEVSITATDPNASESTKDPGVFTVQLDHAAATDTDTDVSYTLGGTAMEGKDYLILVPAGSVTIPAGQTSATINITPKDAHLFSGSKTVVVDVHHGAGYTLNGHESNSTVTIADDDTAPPPSQPNLTVAFSQTLVIPTTLVPGDAATLKGTVSNTGTAPAAGPITVNAYLLPADEALPDGELPIAAADQERHRRGRDRSVLR